MIPITRTRPWIGTDTSIIIKMAGNVVTCIVTCMHNEWDVDLMDTTQSYPAELSSAAKRCTSPLKIV